MANRTAKDPRREIFTRLAAAAYLRSEYRRADPGWDRQRLAQLHGHQIAGARVSQHSGDKVPG